MSDFDSWLREAHPELWYLQSSGTAWFWAPLEVGREYVRQRPPPF